jgi:lactoylglutathione lyase
MFRHLFPILSTPDLRRALAFYRDVLGAEVTYRFPRDGDPVYVSLRLGASDLGIGVQEGPGELTNDRVTLWVYAEDCDRAFAMLRDAGATVVQEPADQPWGERTATVADPDGNPVIVASVGDTSV